MDDIQPIVEALNAEPFRLNLTLLAFHDKSPSEILQVLNDVLSHLDEKQKCDVRVEDKDVLAARTIDFLNILNYKHGMDMIQFRDSLLAGDRRVVYPLLVWLLQRLPDLRKRAYVARYLRKLEVPEELFADEAVVSMYQQYQDLQERFKGVHKQVEKLRATSVDPAELQREIDQLQVEKGQLHTKMERLRGKVESDSQYAQVDFEELLGHVRTLRKEQEEETKLFDSLEEQRVLLYHSQARYKQVAQRLQELAATRGGDPEDILERLREDTDRSEQELQNAERVIRDKEQELHDLQDALSGVPMSEAEVEDLSLEIRQLTQEVNTMEQERNRIQSASDEKIGFYRDQATAVERKKERLLEQLRELRQDKRDADTELSQLNDEAQRLSAGDNPKTDAEEKQYIMGLKAKTVEFTSLKGQLQTLKNEIARLIRTEEILRSQDEDLDDFNRQLEEEQGVAGAIQTQEQLESVSESKSGVDHSKGQALDEMSSIVEQVTRMLKQKKSKLAPQIKELRELRQKCKDVEEVYIQQKQTHDNTVMALDAGRAAIEEELSRNQTTWMAEESSYHFLSCLKTISEAKLMMIREEDSATESKTLSYEQRYNAMIKELDIASKKLVKEKVHLEETVGEKVEQRAMFRSLHNLLEAKLRITQTQQAQQQQEQNYTQLGDGDRMVFE